VKIIIAMQYYLKILNLQMADPLLPQKDFCLYFIEFLGMNIDKNYLLLKAITNKNPVCQEKNVINILK
jgi:hypothetical protein